MQGDARRSDARTLAEIQRAFPGSRLVTTTPQHRPTGTMPPITLVGGFDRPYRRGLERRGIWETVEVVRPGEPIPDFPLHVIATDDASLNLLIGSAIGYDDAEAWTLDGDVVTDGAHLIFVATRQLGEYAWTRWLRFILEGHVGASIMLPLTCVKCEAMHRPRWLSWRDGRGIGWCDEHFAERTVPIIGDVDAGADVERLQPFGRPNNDPEEAAARDAARARALDQRRRLALAKAKARTARNKERQQTMEITDATDD